jgi:hypothetical protein
MDQQLISLVNKVSSAKVVQGLQELTIQLQDVFASIGVANNIVSCSTLALDQADIIGSTPDYRYRFAE